MSKGEIFRADITGDEVWLAYLAAFPEGSNPIYRTRTEHDGSYDRGFIRKLGNTISLAADGTITTLWDADNLQFPYSEVAKTLSELVRSKGVASLFRTKERTVGVQRNIEKLAEGGTKEWQHLYVEVNSKHFCSDVGTVVGDAETTVQVMRRGFEEIDPKAVSEVLDLMAEGALYKGDEFKPAVKQFQTEQGKYLSATPEGQATRLWLNLRTPVSRIRNTVIGTLLQELSEGKDLDFAVRSYEQKTAPTNYKRPTALITKGMIEQATKTLSELGLESALERRLAKISDISVNNVLWVDGKVQPAMKGGGLMSLLSDSIKPTSTEGMKPTPIAVDDFLSTVLPSALALELFFANNLQTNLVSLTAPVNTEVNQMFKWPNNFGWSYNGNITDSIKEKVKAAGGNISAKLRVSLAWFNFDDLDLHAKCPEGHVYYAQKGGDAHFRSGYGHFGPNGQILDVDMNAGGGQTRSPVENLSWIQPKDGTYQVAVNQFSKRETDRVGFTLEIEIEGNVTQYSYHKAVVGMYPALEFKVRSGRIVDLKIGKDLIGQGISQDSWGLSTERFVKVNSVMLSPNFWDDLSVGNKHWFWVLDECKNPEPARGIYNEFLKPELEKHRKVFEVLGNKTKCPVTEEQLSGLGFSSTKRDSAIFRVTDSKSTRVYQVNF